MKNKAYILLLVLMVSSCTFFFKESDDRIKVARVNDSYLYFDDIKDLVSKDATKEDSILVVQNFINRWATQQLFVDGAMLNLSESQQESFNKLITQYKNDLYTKAYIEALVKRTIDTTVTDDEAKEFYEANKEIFKLNEELIKFRYVHVVENMIDFKSIEQKFKRFNPTDQKELDSISVQFKSYSLNDTIWIKVSQVIDKIPIMTTENKNELLKKSNFVQLKDSLGVYLMQINEVLLRSETAPLEYVKPTIEQIVINKRKLELIKELEKDITKDAIKNKQFEIYN
ncbi:MAG: peptidyl-prolyl cis-trans isomerase [Flavobacteriales bacterium]|nr:peptidyl-prolyl cis-trans isomerase [Flavobacteriia bacterium]NCP05025.1 peptidyl-prolyl cis-trans isomerase [Flavobacteriales bacterium]PIV94234.1 MAG: peptidylprolyl isomerase [Flavobacteriaceae bacterium CG17_big_fil_post_rev_8_21_14_2_50_33_15]PIY10721.1 MAG: peptidylprolyl isomerase [Flavobacteriaceae bacterium CG_4_10_14_3_um_filter_33_47]PJB19409.1 MAG: peptidylprolyl isomerase [Flavobacteriaceae bacterium CG_4_9_14_3_um_filter_33_16]